MSASRAWPAPAKLNLFLSVSGRRPDGLHELQTVYQLIELSDQLDFSPSADGVIARTSDIQGVAVADDLTLRAAAALRAAASRPELGVRIRLEKRIPLGSGLGGGSSDAATTLVALDRLWRLGLGIERLSAIGLGLGADVPVFVRGQSAFASGVGEALTPLALPERWYAIVYPGSGTSTREVFQATELTRNSPIVTLRDFLAWQVRGVIPRNDLEPVVVARYPAVRRALAWLGGRGEARLTGSGASVFAAYATRPAAAAALDGLPGEWQGFVARGADHSPLIARRAAEG